MGSTLKDEKDSAKENFVSEKNAAYYAGLYKASHLKGGHIILLNGADSPYFEKTKAEAVSALSAYPGGMQIGGGIRAENAGGYLDAGASHVIVTSYVFQNGKIRKDRLEALKRAVGKERVVLDLSVRRFEDGYYVMTDRWQKRSNVRVDLELLKKLSDLMRRIGRDRIHVTVGSALDLFGGELEFQKLCELCKTDIEKKQPVN